MGAGNGLEGLSSNLGLLKWEGINDQPWEPDSRTWRDRCSPLYNIFFSHILAKLLAKSMSMYKPRTLLFSLEEVFAFSSLKVLNEMINNHFIY